MQVLNPSSSLRDKNFIGFFHLFFFFSERTDGPSMERVSLSGDKDEFLDPHAEPSRSSSALNLGHAFEDQSSTVGSVDAVSLSTSAYSSEPSSSSAASSESAASGRAEGEEASNAAPEAASAQGVDGRTLAGRLRDVAAARATALTDRFSPLIVYVHAQKTVFHRFAIALSSVPLNFHNRT